MLVTLQAFREGDVVTAAGQAGRIRELRIFRSITEGADKQPHTIPGT